MSKTNQMKPVIQLISYLKVLIDRKNITQMKFLIWHRRGYLEYRKSTRDNVIFYSITSKTVDLIEKIELGMPLASFENDFSPTALRNAFSLLFEESSN